MLCRRDSLPRGPRSAVSASSSSLLLPASQTSVPPACVAWAAPPAPEARLLSRTDAARDAALEAADAPSARCWNVVRAKPRHEAMRLGTHATRIPSWPPV